MKKTLISLWALAIYSFVSPASASLTAAEEAAWSSTPVSAIKQAIVAGGVETLMATSGNSDASLISLKGDNVGTLPAAVAAIHTALNNTAFDTNNAATTNVTTKIGNISTLVGGAAVGLNAKVTAQRAKIDTAGTPASIADGLNNLTAQLGVQGTDMTAETSTLRLGIATKLTAANTPVHTARATLVALRDAADETAFNAIVNAGTVPSVKAALAAVLVLLPNASITNTSITTINTSIG